VSDVGDAVTYEQSGGVATVTLNRPDAMNSLDWDTKEQLRDHLATAAADASVRCVVLTGTGRAFCVGQDLKEHATNLVEDAEKVWRTVPEHYNPITLSLLTMPKPVIASVNGVAAGAGAAFAFACDVRLVADTAGFNLAFAAIGLSSDSGSSWTLPRLVGTAKAKELLLTPSTIPAQKALELGLATRLVPAAALPEVTRALAEQLAAGPTVAYGAIKRAVAFSAGHDLEASLAHEAQMMELTGQTQDHLDAVRSFVAKEQPTFHGR
jgi:2-(1,2-epoxy-1,2-dihydrophenyl)acetyl-CoA isomerase